MNTKEVVNFANKHFVEKDGQQIEEKAWMDTHHAMVFVTDRSDVTNIFNNYEAFDAETAKQLIKGTEDDQTVKADFSIEYLKDILKLITKFGESVAQVRIRVGNDKPISFEIENEAGRCLMFLAPRIKDD